MTYYLCFFSPIDPWPNFLHYFIYNKKKSFHIPSLFFSFLSVTNCIFSYHIILMPMMDLVINQLIINQNITIFPTMIALVLFCLKFCVMC